MLLAPVLRDAGDRDSGEVVDDRKPFRDFHEGIRVRHGYRSMFEERASEACLIRECDMPNGSDLLPSASQPTTPPA
jgi:hypothetical protein